MMLAAFDLFSATYLAFLVSLVGVNVSRKNTLLTSIPNMIILRLWIGIVTQCIIINYEVSLSMFLRALVEMTLCYLIEDIYGYAFHRYCHCNKYLYMNVHKLHHDNQAECFTTAFYIHPAELVGFYFIGVMAGPMIVSKLFSDGISLLGMTTWFCAAEFYLFWSHTGYEPANKNSQYAKWIPSTKFHNDHHKYYNCNFSSYYLDSLFGTLRIDA